MNRFLFVALSTCFLFSSCQAQSIATKNPDGSLTVFDGGTPESTITVSPEGNIGIGKAKPTDKLEVNGQIHARAVKVDLKEWADFVFAKDYKPLSLKEIENHITEHGHLPSIPSEKEVLENGIELGEMNKALLRQIEELYLHIIAQNKQLEKLKVEVETLKNKK